MNSDDVRASVLVVEAEPELRDQLTRWLSRAGFDVATCPGPHLTRQACPVDSTGPCELVRSVDVVVLDEWTESDTLLVGPPGWELAVAYHAIGKPLVVLRGEDDPIRFEDDPSVVVLERPPQREALVRAIEDVAFAVVSDPETWLIDATPFRSLDREPL